MSWAAKTPIIVLPGPAAARSTPGRCARSGEHGAGAGALPGPTVACTASVSCQEARITSGTSTAISGSMTRAMPSAAKVKRASQVGIQRYDSRNWNRAPPASNAA